MKFDFSFAFYFLLLVLFIFICLYQVRKSLRPTEIGEILSKGKRCRGKMFDVLPSTHSVVHFTTALNFLPGKKVNFKRLESFKISFSHLTQYQGTDLKNIPKN